MVIMYVRRVILLIVVLESIFSVCTIFLGNRNTFAEWKSGKDVFD